MAARIPRKEYPRPTMVRPEWISLNGQWKFEFDHGLSGLDEGWAEGHDYSRRILVPFAPESRLSGIGDRDFHPAVWYEREFDAPRLGSRRLLLHFGASDYETRVFVNGRDVGSHRGGYTPFSFDVTSYVRKGANRLTVYARDDTRSGAQPSGKQSLKRESHGCYYTRTTGIWQTVWAEVVPAFYISRVAAVPGRDLKSVRVAVEVAGSAGKTPRVRAVARADSKTVSGAERELGGGRAVLDFRIFDARRWSPDDPFLYDLEITLLEGRRTRDRVCSYLGMRSVEVSGSRLLLNGEPLYLKTVLDQGFYPEGVYTAPSDRALRRDIELARAAGFNGARLHQKIFEPRFLYWADRLGYLCWGEAPDWGADLTYPVAQNNLTAEWVEAIRRDIGHPSIIAWVATNEQHPEGHGRRAEGDFLAGLYRTLKDLDPSRPTVDNSGYWHTLTDIVDIHDYGDGASLRKGWRKFGRSGRPEDIPAKHCPAFWPGYAGLGGPVHLSEVGGIGFAARGAAGWGYGNVPRTKRAFMKRYADTMRAITDISSTCGFCYTQLYDVEQEINGLYTYDRRPKFDMAAVRRINEGR